MTHSLDLVILGSLVSPGMLSYVVPMFCVRTLRP